ncbi:isoprenylcysteine carboxylmethyltransferase family protein [Aeromicrobium panaciterrae]|uniref:methyltransferase family protein n=1 Tax=Aeromicrobium panaciterrae TaxID=363861 RepID=UPI0031CF623B
MSKAAWGTVVFFFAAPGVVGGLLPWWIAGDRDPGPLAMVIAGCALVVLGVWGVIAAFAQFVREGRGTPAPIAPTEELVVGGLYRFVRNPMYLFVGAIIGGQAVIFTSWAVAGYLVAFFALVFSFVTFYEQPTLRETYGASYDDYLAAVPGWWPRLTPWDGSTSASTG